MISHHHQTVFVHIPKCGGMSVEHLFLDDLGLTWGQRAPLLLRLRSDEEQAPPRLAHLSARQYVAGHYLTEAMWRDYLTFAVVRDPFSRVVSMFRYLGFDRMTSFARFVGDYLPAALGDPGHAWHWFLRPQAAFVTDDEGRLAVDHLVRLEHIGEELPAVLSKVGLDVEEVPHVNAGKRLRQRRMAALRVQYLRDAHRLPRLAVAAEARWSKSSRSVVEELYREDFGLLA